jgi:hypothetical protein
MKNFIRQTLANETIKSSNSESALLKILDTLSDDDVLAFLSADGLALVEAEKKRIEDAKKPKQKTAPMKNLINEFRNLSGAKFVGFEYRNAQGELSHYTMLSNISYGNWVDKKIAILEILDEIDFADIATAHEDERITPELVSEAKIKLLEALIKNKNKETASNQSKAQNEAYVSVGGGVRLHLESKKYQAFGFLVSRKVIEKGEPKKPVNSKPLTLAKNAIEKHCGFSKFITINIEKPETVVNITGGTYQMQ